MENSVLHFPNAAMLLLVLGNCVGIKIRLTSPDVVVKLGELNIGVNFESRFAFFSYGGCGKLC